MGNSGSSTGASGGSRTAATSSRGGTSTSGKASANSVGTSTSGKASANSVGTSTSGKSTCSGLSGGNNRGSTMSAGRSGGAGAARRDTGSKATYGGAASWAAGLPDLSTGKGQACLSTRGCGPRGRDAGCRSGMGSTGKGQACLATRGCDPRGRDAACRSSRSSAGVFGRDVCTGFDRNVCRGFAVGKCADPMQASCADPSCSQVMSSSVDTSSARWAGAQDRQRPPTHETTTAPTCSTAQLGTACAIGAATGAMPSAWFNLPGAVTGAAVGCVVGMATQAMECERDTQTRVNLAWVALTPPLKPACATKQERPKFMRGRYKYNPHCR